MAYCSKVRTRRSAFLTMFCCCLEAGVGGAAAFLFDRGIERINRCVVEFDTVFVAADVNSKIVLGLQGVFFERARLSSFRSLTSPPLPPIPAILLQARERRRIHGSSSIDLCLLQRTDRPERPRSERTGKRRRHASEARRIHPRGIKQENVAQR